MPAWIIAHRRTDHACRYTPLTQEASNDRGVVKHELTKFPHERAGIVFGQPVNHHDRDRCQHAKAYIRRRNSFGVGHIFAQTLRGCLISVWASEATKT